MFVVDCALSSPEFSGFLYRSVSGKQCFFFIIKIFD